MIKIPKVNKVNVILLDGAEYLGCDIPPQPMGEHGKIISFFYQGESIKIIPLDLVKEINLYWENENE